MSPSGRVLITKTVHIVSKFSESRGCRSPGQTGTYNNDPVLSLVCRVNQFGRETMVVPLFGKGSLRYFGIEIHSNVLGLIPYRMANGSENKDGSKNEIRSNF